MLFRTKDAGLGQIADLRPAGEAGRGRMACSPPQATRGAA